MLGAGGTARSAAFQAPSSTHWGAPATFDSRHRKMQVCAWGALGPRAHSGGVQASASLGKPSCRTSSPKHHLEHRWMGGMK
eukprot:5931006-Alexandrium_andersonii.AAC.1